MMPHGTATNETPAYFEHGADVGVIGRGPTLEAAFESAAGATFALMADPAAIAPSETVHIEFDESDDEFALVTWLNQLVTQSRIHGVIFSRFLLQRNGSHWRGEARGGPWPKEMDRGVEVKGATLTMLAVKHAAHGWEARCVVDV